MAKDPADRHQTPIELARDLEAWAEEGPKLVSAPRSSQRPSWIKPPTQSPSKRPGSDVQPQQTRFLDKIEVFRPSQKAVESSGPSLLEPEWKYAPSEQRRPDSHDTLALSRVEETEEDTSQGIVLEEQQPPSDLAFDADSRPPEPACRKAPSSPSGELPPVDRVLLRLWPRWTELVGSLITGQGSSRVDDDAYRTVHTLLLQSCRAAIDACAFPERRAFYEECLSVAQPWFKLQTFARADPSILESLLRRCRQLEVELNEGKRPWTFRQVLALVLLATSPAGAVLWYFYYGRVWLPSLFKALNGEFTISSLRSAWDFLQSHPTLLMGVIFPLVVVFSIALLSRNPRT
jgi:hypothetical protein